MNHLMIDIETLSTQPNAVICAIGAVFFEPSTGKIGKRFYQTIDPRSAEKNGAHISADTVLWWFKCDAEVRAELLTAESSEYDALASFAFFILQQVPAAERKRLKVWCKGGSFDFPILKSAYGRYDMGLPWLYWNECCFRSLLTVAGTTGYVPHPRRTVAHNALTDAVYQAEQVGEIWQRLTTPHLESL